MCHSSIAFFLLNLKGGGGFYCILEKLGSLGVVKPFANCKFVLNTKMSFKDRQFANHFDLLIGALKLMKADTLHSRDIKFSLERFDLSKRFLKNQKLKKGK